MKTKGRHSTQKRIVIMLCALVALWSNKVMAEEITEKEILSVLPKGAVIATIPTCFDKAGRVLAWKSAVLQAKIFPGDSSQLIVGYFTEAEPPTGQSADDSFYTRCHVALLGKDEQDVRVLWDSGGWGFEFGTERHGETFSDEQASLFLQACDLNDEGGSELIFSRRSFRAEGSRFEIWQYDPAEKRLVQLCDASGSINLLKVSSPEWPGIEATSFHASKMSSVLMEYDSTSRTSKGQK